MTTTTSSSDVEDGGGNVGFDYYTSMGTTTTNSHSRTDDVEDGGGNVGFDYYTSMATITSSRSRSRTDDAEDGGGNDGFDYYTSMPSFLSESDEPTATAAQTTTSTSTVLAAPSSFSLTTIATQWLVGSQQDTTTTTPKSHHHRGEPESSNGFSSHNALLQPSSQPKQQEQLTSSPLVASEGDDSESPMEWKNSLRNIVAKLTFEDLEPQKESTATTTTMKKVLSGSETMHNSVRDLVTKMTFEDLDELVEEKQKKKQKNLSGSDSMRNSVRDLVTKLTFEDLDELVEKEKQKKKQKKNLSSSDTMRNSVRDLVAKLTFEDLDELVAKKKQKQKKKQKNLSGPEMMRNSVRELVTKLTFEDLDELVAKKKQQEQQQQRQQHPSSSSYSWYAQRRPPSTAPALLASPSQQEKRHQAYQVIRKGIRLSMWHCALLVVCYLGLSVVVFSFMFQKWTIIDSCYFAVATFSTNGYGDLFPENEIERIFTCFFVLSGVSALSVTLGMLGSNLIDMHEETVARANKINQQRAMSLFRQQLQANAPKNATSEHDEDGDEADDDPFLSTASSCANACGNACGSVNALVEEQDLWNTQKLTLINWAVASVICLLGYLIGNDEGWDLKTTIYFGIITASTVGYGDFVPTSQYSRLLGVVFIPLAAVSMGRCIQLIAKAIINRRRRQSIESFCTNKELSLGDFEVMDRNGDGVVGWSDFLEFMLIAMHKVDSEMLDELRRQFDRLDVDKSGFLDKKDLLDLARRELYSTRGKLQRSLYKL